jgi:hypothetical protein
MNGHFVLLRSLLQQAQKRLVIGRISKYWLAVIATLNDVVRVVWEGEARLAGHAGSLPDYDKLDLTPIKDFATKLIEGFNQIGWSAPPSA